MLDKIDIMKLQARPIEEVASALGLSVSHHKALCPFHNDSTPSLTFHRGRNRYRCFVCDAHGGTIDLVMNHLHYSFLDACRWLNDHSGSLVDFDKFSGHLQSSVYSLILICPLRVKVVPLRIWIRILHK